jgi:hypothetical protein
MLRFQFALLTSHSAQERTLQIAPDNAASNYKMKEHAICKHSWSAEQIYEYSSILDKTTSVVAVRTGVLLTGPDWKCWI